MWYIEFLELRSSTNKIKDVQPTVYVTYLYLFFLEATASNSTSESDMGHAMGEEEESGAVSFK